MTADGCRLPLVDAAFLFSQAGCEAVADVALPDGTVPVNGRWRMDSAEWRRYRAGCALRGLREAQMAQEIQREGCAS